MKTKHFILIFLLTCGFTAKAQNDFSPVDYVNPLTGTMSSYKISAGNLYPVIGVPWGMNFWTPQTGQMGNGWIYTYTENQIKGFKEAHQPSPWIGDYGDFSLMPVTGKPCFDENERAGWFSHQAETAKPYYYKVYLGNHNVTTEIAPTCRAAAFRFSFAKSDSAYVVIDAFDKSSYVKIIPEKREIIGYSSRNSGGVRENFKNYFIIKFDRQFAYASAVTDGKINPETTESRCNHAGCIVGFGTDGGKVNASVASSFISAEQAELNLKEIEGKNLEEIAAQGKAEWNKMLGRIEVNDNDIDKLRTFYTCLYRSLLFPHTMFEKDPNGNIFHYSPFDGKIEKGYFYTDVGLWDTFRALFPLLNFVYPSINTNMQESFLNIYKESGFLPEWISPGHRDCMIGNNSTSVIADAFLSGIKNSDVETLWKAVVHDANSVHPQIKSTGRLGFELYNQLGYVPYDKGINENAARTLEYAYDDWAIYQFGKKLGKPAKEIDVFKKHAQNYRNLFNKEFNLMCGRNADGSFVKPFNPLKWGDAFTEGNSWHYTWSVFHDPQGLIDLMGGKENFNNMMDSIFVQAPRYDESYYHGVIHEIREMQIINFGQYAHGNQPIQHALYLYDYSGQPWKSQYWTREVMERLYKATPDGYCGDEDNGQTSAWYVFSAMGFYPVCPGSLQYALGTPYFNQVKIHLENGKDVVIDAPNESSANKYINSMTVNNNIYTKNYLSLDELRGGAHIVYQMSDKPNLSRGTKAEDFPYSFTNELKKK